MTSSSVKNFTVHHAYPRIVCLAFPMIRLDQGWPSRWKKHGTIGISVVSMVLRNVSFWWRISYRISSNDSPKDDTAKFRGHLQHQVCVQLPGQQPPKTNTDAMEMLRENDVCGENSHDEIIWYHPILGLWIGIWDRHNGIYMSLSEEELDPTQNLSFSYWRWWLSMMNPWINLWIQGCSMLVACPPFGAPFRSGWDLASWGRLAEHCHRGSRAGSLAGSLVMDTITNRFKGELKFK